MVVEGMPAGQERSAIVMSDFRRNLHSTPSSAKLNCKSRN